MPQASLSGTGLQLGGPAFSPLSALEALCGSALAALPLPAPCIDCVAWFCLDPGTNLPDRELVLFLHLPNDCLMLGGGGVFLPSSCLLKNPSTVV